MSVTPGADTQLDKRLVDRVLAVVDRLGKTVGFHIEPDKEWNVDLQRVETSGEVSVVTKRVTPPEPFKMSEIDGDLVQVGDMRIFLPAKGLTFTPKANMKVELPGNEFWFITGHIGRIFTGEKLALYDLGLRRTGSGTT